MPFVSKTFLFFFLPILFVSYAAAPKRVRNLILLSASIFFYAWGGGAFIAVLFFLVLANFVLARLIGSWRASRPAAALSVLWLGIALHVSVLAYYKYTAFLLGSLGFSATGPALPLGISFFTFHAISYLIDVYRGDAEAQPHISDLALYTFFFPQLIAGPIIRYKHIAPQIAMREERLALFAKGVRRFVIGLAKKVLLANTYAPTADYIFSLAPAGMPTTIAWLGVLSYALEIYFDFSGYSDMAIGLGAMFGFVFPENFNYPYIASSMRDFWRRWHMSLYQWFRDYVYIPLGGARRGLARTLANILVVFLLLGLWHGASWTFVLWGALHGVLLSAERILERYAIRIPTFVGRTYTIFAVLMLWVLFRSPDAVYALQYLQAMFSVAHATLFIDPSSYSNAFFWTMFAIGCAAATGIPARLGRAFLSTTESWRFQVFNGAIRVFFLSSLLILSLASIAAETYMPFIYFRF